MVGRIIVLGNEKGGSGKTTISIHIAICLACDGYSVGCIDLDSRQRSFSRYIENRVSYVSSNNLDLPMVQSIVYPESEINNSNHLEVMTDYLVNKHDVVIIDTPGAASAASFAAHGIADVIITPINDSFIDLDLLGQIRNDDYKQIHPGVYSQVIWSQKLKRAKENNRAIDWVVMRNRLSNLEARNKANVERALGLLSKKFGFRICSAFSERVIFRELFTRGLTLMDVMRSNEKPTMSHIAARQELRNLMRDLGIMEKVQ